MPRGGVFPRPVLKFGGGTALTPREGLSLFSPVRGPKKVSMALVGERGLEGKVKRIAYYLTNGAKNYISMDILFGVQVEATPVSSGDLRKSLEDAASTGVDVVVVGIYEDVPEESDMYVEAKQLLAGLGVPSQMIVKSTLDNKYRDPYVLFNLAVNIYAKAGGIPWGIADAMERDVYVGIDIGGGVLAAALLVTPGEPRVKWNVFPTLDVEYTASVGEAVRWAVEEAGRLLGRRPLSLHIQRDGRIHWGELESIRDTLGLLESEGLLPGGYGYTVLEVRKRVTPMLLRRSGDRITNPEKGAYFQIDEDNYVVATTGWPERRISAGTVRPVAVRRVDTSNWDEPSYTDVKEVFWLSSLHWGSMFTTPRMPITTLYPHRVSRFFGLGVYPDPDRMGGLWFL